MSNIFKPNTRFDVLADEIQETKKNKKKYGNDKKQENIINVNNIFKREHENRCNNFSNNGYNSFTNYRSGTFDNKSKEQNEKRLEEEKKKKSLTPENFPEIISSNINNANKNINKKNIMNFSEKLKSGKKENELKEIDFDYENLKPGWVILKKDPLTGKKIKKYKESQIPKPREKTQKEIGLDVLNGLVELHKKRTKEYIEMWGYHTWEKLYRFPNYDYEYFDKLDELYEEMENEYISEESDEEY